ncbi:hypothetical protein BLNAU_20123 [Blattamonas nauphoetae]|uniref:Uncharacterized protein n=1 Tax=Blattamonas nauphoetae TaxID=2049346 RepID=A0ABQ9WZT1_9EUKA|nr:hypothetical protein BLNAU_20123 [Blattamonas nauphoetae]
MTRQSCLSNDPYSFLRTLLVWMNQLVQQPAAAVQLRANDDEELYHATTPPNELSSQHCRHPPQIAVQAAQRRSSNRVLSESAFQEQTSLCISQLLLGCDEEGEQEEDLGDGEAETVRRLADCGMESENSADETPRFFRPNASNTHSHVVLTPHTTTIPVDSLSHPHPHSLPKTLSQPLSNELVLLRLAEASKCQC